MTRVIPLVCAAVLVAGCGSTTHSARSAWKSPWPRHAYSVGQIERAFAAQGVPLRVRAASDRAVWVRLGATVPLQLIVFHTVGAAGRARVQLITTAHPGPLDFPDDIPLRLGPPHGWATGTNGGLFANISFAYYYNYPGLDRRVRAALHRLHVPAGFLS